MSQGLNITIIGYGIAGALTARVLREKHNVTLLERSAMEHEIGAAINLGPNACKILDQYGFDKKKAGSIAVSRTRILTPDGKVIIESKLPDLEAIFGGEWIVQHRADLWNELSRLATAPSDDLKLTGNPAKVIWDVEVIDVDTESGDVKLRDGRVIQSDLVIGADGIKSIVRPLVVGDVAFNSARPSGSSTFRFLLPRAVVDKVAPGLSVMDASKPADIEIHLAEDGSKRSIVVYPCRNYELLNLGCLAPDAHIKLETTESWSSSGTRDDLLRCFGDYSSLRPLLEAAENIKLWQLRDQDPLPTYIKGRTVIIGDSAHAMTPHQGQGGSQAVEDGEGLSLFIDQHVDRQSVGRVLQDFDRVRRTRASRVQNITREVHKDKTAENIWKNMQYNFTYGGVRDCLAKLDAGQTI